MGVGGRAKSARWNRGRAAHSAAARASAPATRARADICARSGVGACVGWQRARPTRRDRRAIGPQAMGRQPAQRNMRHNMPA